ncbi:MAG TPA: hypothetical protein VGM78_06260 [Ilumatobacteraceae bacterium]
MTGRRKVGSIRPYRRRWRVVVTVGVRPDGKPHQIVRSAPSEDQAHTLLAAMIAEYGLTGDRKRGHGREPGERPFAVGDLLAGGALGLLPRRSLQSVAAALDLPLEVARAYARTGLTTFEADRWAVACKVHPFEVWGWAWVERAASSELADAC